MYILKRLKLFLTGHGGNSISQKRTCPLQDHLAYTKEIQEVRERLEQDTVRLQQELAVADVDEESRQSIAELSDIVELLQQTVQDSMNEEEHSTHNEKFVRVEQRNINTLMHSEEENIGKLLLANNRVIRINRQLFRALCKDRDYIRLEKQNSMSLYELFPRDVVRMVMKLFHKRKLNSIVYFELGGYTYQFMLDEFVKNGICYRQVSVLNLKESDTE